MIFYFISIFVLTYIFQFLYIRYICKTKFFSKVDSIDVIKKSCIKELHKQKQSTPAIGGLSMLLSLLIISIVYTTINNHFLWINILLILYGIMGFIDDFIKLKSIKDGVKPSTKLLGLTVISIFVVFFILNSNTYNNDFYLFSNNISVNKLLFIPLVIFLIVASTNSMNITDGLDGLALGISIIILSSISILSYHMGKSDILLCSLLVLGTCLATLLYNKYPAKLFIGDTGSLMLGAAIAVLLILLGHPLLIIPMMGVCIWETISVIIQLTSKKLFNKKVFYIAPYHHHLEKCGFSESRIVFIFCSITFVLCTISVILVW